MVNIMNETTNCAEKLDKMNKGVAWGMLVCGVTFLIIAAEKVVEPGQLNSVLDFAGGFGAMVTLVITFTACYPVIKMLLSGNTQIKKENESFMSNTMNTSFKNSWIITMMFLVIILSLQNIIDGLNIAPSFYFVLLFGFMTLSAAINFLYLSRDDDSEHES